MGSADGFDLSGIAAVNILLIEEQKKHRATPRVKLSLAKRAADNHGGTLSGHR